LRHRSECLGRRLRLGGRAASRVGSDDCQRRRDRNHRYRRPGPRRRYGRRTRRAPRGRRRHLFSVTHWLQRSYRHVERARRPELCVIDQNVAVGAFGWGDGLLVVSAPTTVSVGGTGTIGTDGPDRGDVTVVGPGALLEVGGGTSSRLHIGYNGGTGTLNVLDDA